MEKNQKGRWFEDFVVGEIIKHRPGRTILESDNTWFTLLTNNNHPIHFDYHYASKTQFGKPLVNSALTLAIVTGMSVEDVSYRSIANLEWSFIKLPNPVFIGDTIHTKVTIKEKKDDPKRPQFGQVVEACEIINQNDKVVCYSEHILLVERKTKS